MVNYCERSSCRLILVVYFVWSVVVLVLLVVVVLVVLVIGDGVLTLVTMTPIVNDDNSKPYIDM